MLQQNYKTNKKKHWLYKKLTRLMNNNEEIL